MAPMDLQRRDASSGCGYCPTPVRFAYLAGLEYGSPIDLCLGGRQDVQVVTTATASAPDVAEQSAAANPHGVEPPEMPVAVGVEVVAANDSSGKEEDSYLEGVVVAVAS